MSRLKRALFAAALVIWDAISVLLSFIIGFRLRFGFVAAIPYQYIEGRWLVISICFVVVVLMNCMFKAYTADWKRANAMDVARLTLSAVFVSIVFYMLDRLFVLGMPVEVIIIVTGLLLAFMLLGRLSMRAGSYVRARIAFATKEDLKNVIVYGGGEAGQYFLRKIAGNPDNDLRPVAILDDKRDLWGRKIGNVRCVGGKEKLARTIREYKAEEVIIAIAEPDIDLMKDLMSVCKANRCILKRFGVLDDVVEEPAKVSLTQINLEDLLRRDRVKLNMEVVRRMLHGKTVLVTGGVGSIGSEICRQVLAYGAKKLIIFDINENGLFYLDNQLKKDYDPARYALKLGSIRDKDRLQEIFKEYKPQIVFHAAAHKHVPMMEGNPKEAIKNNVFGTIKVAQTAIFNDAEKFILISTDKAVNPTNIMGASKRIAEMVIQMFDGVSKTELAAVRFGNVLGSNGSVVPFFLAQIKAGGPVTVTHPDMKRYFMTIPEAVQLVLEAGTMAAGGEIFVLDMGQPVKIYDLACDLIRLSGLRPEKDIKIVFTGLRPGEKLFEEISLAEEDTTKTSNNKIFINKPIENDPIRFAHTIKDLERTISDRNKTVDEMFGIVKGLVPTFQHKMEKDG